MASAAPELRLHLREPAQLFEVYLDDQPQGGVFIAGHDHVAAGDAVLVHISFPHDDFRLRGKVLWRRTRRGGAGRVSMQRGAAVVFAEDQAPAVRRLLSFAREASVIVARRASRRRPFTAKVRYDSRFGLARDLVRDVSLGGLRIHSAKPPAVGAPIIIFLRPPRALTALRLVGEVVWRELGVDPTFGVRFLHASPRDRRRLQRLIDGLG